MPRRVLITGASRGIGLAIARGFAAEGAELYLLADDREITAVAAELGAAGGWLCDITVNAVCPGWVRTRASLRSLAAMSARAEREEGAVLDEILSAQSLPGFMEPEDVVGMYLYLASDQAANITGQALNVDRGEFMG